jgi:DNA topoisomerase-2
LFHKNDEPLLTYLNEDGMSIEPEWYCPIIPTVLVNGANGVGTGYSTDIPSYNPLALSNNMKYWIRQERERQRLLNDPTSEPKKYPDVLTLETLTPWYKNYTGEIKLLDNDRTRGVINGVCAKLDDTSIEITDLPVGTWTQQYKENVLEGMLHPKRTDIAPSILDYKGKFSVNHSRVHPGINSQIINLQLKIYVSEMKKCLFFSFFLIRISYRYNSSFCC